MPTTGPELVALIVASPSLRARALRLGIAYGWNLARLAVVLGACVPGPPIVVNPNDLARLRDDV
jgi:hypothetical protein